MGSSKLNFKERSQYGRKKTQAQHRRRPDHNQTHKEEEWRRGSAEKGRRKERLSKTELVSKLLRNAALWEIKVLPMFASLMIITTLLLTYFDCGLVYVNIIEEIYYAGTMVMLFTLSYLFKFCGYHRLFIWYIVVNHYMALIDTHVTIPLSDKHLLGSYLLIAGIFSFLILNNYLKHKSNESK